MEVEEQMSEGMWVEGSSGQYLPHLLLTCYTTICHKHACDVTFTRK